MKVGYLVIGRLKSSRLRNKLLLEIQGKSIISHLFDRLKHAKKVDEIILCTSNLKEDKPLVKLAKNNKVKCFLGDPDDVLERMLGAAIKHKLDYILTITADCPLVDPFYADAIVDTYLETKADLIRQFDLPHGAFSYGIKIEALKKVIQIKDTKDTEVWGRYFTDTGLFRVIDFKVKNKFHKRPELRMTLDYPEDFKFFEMIFKKLYKKGRIFSLDEILKLLDNFPEISKINNSLHVKFIKKWKKQSEIKLKKIQKVKKAVIIGCGSIGQRHIKNLKKIGIKFVYAFRSRKGHYHDLPKGLNIIEYDNWNDLINEKPDIAIISNPTSLHLKFAMKVVPFVKGVFIEKPISNSLLGIHKLVKLIKKKKIVFFVGHNFMFHPIIENIKNFLDASEVGKMLNIQCQVGHWLPDWHPYENYKKSYSAKKNLGGGAVLTLIHEIHLALNLAGRPLEVCGMKSNSSSLNVEKDLDVISDLMIKHSSGCVSQIHLDFIQKPLHRRGLISCERGWLSYDFVKQNVFVQKANMKRPKIMWSDIHYDNNNMYVQELECFINYVEQGRIKHPSDIFSGIESLLVVEAFFKSIERKQLISISKNFKSELV